MAGQGPWHSENLWVAADQVGHLRGMGEDRTGLGPAMFEAAEPSRPLPSAPSHGTLDTSPDRAGEHADATVAMRQPQRQTPDALVIWVRVAVPGGPDRRDVGKHRRQGGLDFREAASSSGAAMSG